VEAQDGDTADPGEEGDAPDGDSDEGDAGDESPTAWLPAAGAVELSPVDCSGHEAALPAAFAGPKGLGAVGWTEQNLTNTAAWNIPTRFAMRWISDNSNESESLRVRPHLAPRAASCYSKALQDAVGAPQALPEVLEATSAYFFADRALDGLESLRYAPPAAPEEPALRTPGAALRGLWAAPNPLLSAPELEAEPTEEELAQWAEALDSAVPSSAAPALAQAIAVLGEAAILAQRATAQGSAEHWLSLFEAYRSEKYWPSNSSTWAFMSPVGGGAIEATLAVADELDRQWIAASAQRVSAVALELEAALVGISPTSAERVDVPTPYGRIVLDLDGGDDAWQRDELDGAALFVDLGGNDTYVGRMCSTATPGMGAAICLELGGNDIYGPEVAEIVAPAVVSKDALGQGDALTLAFGLFGTAVLIDSGGNDRYAASAHAQGAGAFGAGILLDRAGDDVYRSTLLGQGIGTFGIGLLLDLEGNDDYAVFAVGQGTGRPGGNGLLLDLGGADNYTALYNDDPPELPEPGFPNIYGTLSGYSDSLSENHYINAAQGTGWGYRGDWLSPQINWGGGFGALVDLGSDDDVHYADCLSIGQGFVYGFGLFFNEGGNDFYRAFWWAYGSGTHMGTGVFWEGGGDDDYLATRASATLGHDTGVSWFLERGGDDHYAGALNFGKSLENGMAFFLDLDGVDTYVLPAGADADPAYRGFGVVDVPMAGLPRVGAFFDLGGDEDIYSTARPEVGNNKAWQLPPSGPQANAEIHKGIGLDE
jgi:hypothetical protein